MVLVIAIVGVLGLAIGSFLNVVIYRVPARLSVVRPPSACPNCATPIRPRDNVPLLSWIMLKGRCRDCGEPISVRYPLVELATAITYVVVGLAFVPPVLAATSTIDALAASFGLVAFLYLAAVSIALTAIDIDSQRLPDKLVLPAYLIGGALLALSGVLGGDYDSLIRAGVGLVALFVAYLVMALAYPGGMGMGDVKLAGVLGMYLAWLGYGNLLVGAFAPFLFGGLFAIGLIVARRAGRKTKVPFGPWMLLGSWIGILAGDAIFKGYLRIVGLA